MVFLKRPSKFHNIFMKLASFVRSFLTILAVFVLIFSSCRQAHRVDVQGISYLETPTQSLLQAISITPKNTIYVSGHDATVLRKFGDEDSFSALNIAVPDSFQFRDIHGFDNGVVVAMSAGPGIMSQIWRSEDFGDSWKQVFEMDEEEGFLDCMDFWDEQNGLVFGDAVDGIYVLKTEDGGKSWYRMNPSRFPSESTGGFAASGTCIETSDHGEATIIGYLANRQAPLYHSSDFGETWTRDSLALVVDEVSGGTSFSSNEALSLAVGGDLMTSSDSSLVRVALRENKGMWNYSAPAEIGSALYGSAIGEGNWPVISIVGPKGWAVSVDKARSFTQVDDGNFWATEVTSDRVYAVGRGGKVAYVPVEQYWD